MNVIGLVAIIILCLGATVNNKGNSLDTNDKFDVLERKIDRLENKLDRMERQINDVNGNVSSVGKDLYDKLKDVEYAVKSLK